MKVLTRLSVAAIILISAFGTASAQKFKFGYTDSQTIIESLPETKAAKDELTALADKHKKRYEEMQVEYQNKYTEIVENSQLVNGSPEKWDELTMEDKQRELMGLQDRLTSFEQSATDKINQRQVELFTPISEKVKKAINDVAVEGGYTFIFEATSLLYIAKDQSIDVTADIKKKLGLQ
jgi:outer membrane protein